jgi:hypothetical protein
MRSRLLTRRGRNLWFHVSGVLPCAGVTVEASVAVDIQVGCGRVEDVSTDNRLPPRHPAVRNISDAFCGPAAVCPFAESIYPANLAVRYSLL